MEERCDEGDQGVQAAEYQNRHLLTSPVSSSAFDEIWRGFEIAAWPQRDDPNLVPLPHSKVLALIIKAAMSKQSRKLSQPKLQSSSNGPQSMSFAGSGN